VETVERSGAEGPVRLPADDAGLLALALPGGLPPGGGLFAPESAIRRVSGQSAVLFGGGCALLLEVAHPLVAAGVAEHSDFRRDPFGRLRRTLDAMNAIAFGDVRAAVAAARGIERAHGRVHGHLARATGRFPAGTPYHGRDPELVRWVWATLADTALRVYERFVEPLPEAARQAYHADHAAMARILGVPARLVPADAAAFRAYFDGMLDDVLAVGDEAREIAQAVLAPPVGADGARFLRAITTGLLPPVLREAFGLRWDDGKAERFEALTRSVRELRVDGAGARR
jgi:uncharacterized protein (DUF2236 family)